MLKPRHPTHQPTSIFPPKQYRQVHKFNGQPVRNLRHLAEMVCACEDRFMRFELAYNVRQTPPWVLVGALVACSASCCRPSRRSAAAGAGRGPPRPAVPGPSLPMACPPPQEILVIETAKVAAATEEILRMHSIPAMVSPDLADLLQGAKLAADASDTSGDTGIAATAAEQQQQQPAATAA